MPINVTQGNSAQFFVEFYDQFTGALTVPSSATLTITYTAVAGSTASTVLGMIASGNGFGATWGTSVAAYGLALWSVMAPGQTAPTTGTLRLLDP
jgi:hypothetical protein